MKKINFVIFALAFFLLAMPLTLAEGQSTTVCCEKTIDGLWCQDTESTQCSTQHTAAQTSCSQTSFCQLGTCVNTNSGVCTSNVPRQQCLDEGGEWFNQDRSEIEMCAGGCCQIGDGVAFVSQTECKQLASDYGVSIQFNAQITDEASCLELAEPTDTGACLYDEGGVRSCRMLEKSQCISTGGNFFDGILCTASELESDCSPSSETTCYNDDVYFLDTCGNLANIYDPLYDPNLKEDAWGNTQRDYWTDKIIDYENAGLDLEGDCDYALGSTCASDRGVDFCKDLSCETTIDGEEVIKNHGESWCAETPGTLHHILVDPETMEYLDDSREKLIENYDEYNIPGSRYVRLQCWEGEVIEEPCADYRNEICKEADIGTETIGEEFTVAQCRANPWRSCLNITSKNSCEDQYLDCIWVEGYRFDGQELPTHRREQEQGSCLPLYAPGFDFWSEDLGGESVCASGNVNELVLYETHWLTEEREELEFDKKLATQNCYDNCYSVPGYGEGISEEELKRIHEGTANFVDAQQVYISDRLGYYCEDKTGKVNVLEIGFEDGGIAEGTFSDKIMCADESYQPLFYTNENWLNSLKMRTSLLGDCGYKNNLVGEYSDNSTQIITTLFQQLTQKGEVKVNSTSREIYSGSSWTGEDERTNQQINENTE